MSRNDNLSTGPYLKVNLSKDGIFSTLKLNKNIENDEKMDFGCFFKLCYGFRNTRRDYRKRK